MVGDSEAAVKWVRAQSNHNGKVGVFGSCSGGRHAFIYACQRKDVDACVDLGRPRGDGRGLGLSLALKTAKELRAALDYPLRPDHVPAPRRIAGERSALHADRRIPDGHGEGRSAGDAEAADAIQIDRIEFIASPSFDIRIGF